MTRRNRRITPDERHRVTALAAEGWSRNAIARELGRSTGAVSRIAAEAGVTFDRAATAAATSARQADQAATRVELGCSVLEAAEAATARLEAVTDHHDRLAAAKTVSALVNAYARLAALDADRGTEAEQADVDAWLHGMIPDHPPDTPGDQGKYSVR